MRVPQTAGNGNATATLSYPQWKELKPATIEFIVETEEAAESDQKK